MKLAALIAAAITIAAPAMAQPTTWSTNQTGGQFNHWGYDQSGNVWSGTTTQMGDQTINRFRSPDGQVTTCTVMQMGAGNAITRCQ